MNDRTIESRWLALVAATGIFLYLCWTMLAPFLQVLLWAVVLVIIFDPVHRFLLERTRRPALSAVAALLLEMLTVVVPLLLVGAAVASELAALANTAQERFRAVLADPVQGERLRHAVAFLKQYVDVDALLSGDAPRELLGQMSQAAARRTLSVVGGALGFVVSLAFVLFTMFYLFRDGREILRHLPEFLPLDRDESERLLHRTREIINASVYGVLVIALIQGTLGGLMFAVLGVPSALVWAVLMTVVCTIPMAGSFLVWGPVALFLALTGHVIKAVVLAVWGAFIIGMADNLLRPRLVGRRTRLHELLVFFSVLGGLRAFGILGILFGPVVLAVTLALLDLLRRGRAPAAS